MLGKLLKYELKATGRLLLPLYGVLLLFSVINRIFFAVDRSTAIMESFFAQLVMNLTVFVYGVVVAAVFVVTFFVSVSYTHLDVYKRQVPRLGGISVDQLYAPTQLSNPRLTGSISLYVALQ